MLNWLKYSSLFAIKQAVCSSVYWANCVQPDLIVISHLFAWTKNSQSDFKDYAFCSRFRRTVCFAADPWPISSRLCDPVIHVLTSEWLCWNFILYSQDWNPGQNSASSLCCTSTLLALFIKVLTRLQKCVSTTFDVPGSIVPRRPDSEVIIGKTVFSKSFPL